MTKRMAIPMILAFALVGCAKQPSTTTGASAPAPGGAVGMTVASGGMDPAGSVGAGGSGRYLGGSGSTTRPALEGFRPATELADIHFEFDRADIREADVARLDANAGWLKSNADQLVVIEGHCDERGTTAYNTALGDRRARATKNYLVSRGVPAARITVISYGEERPVCAQADADCWAKNRRAHFLVKSR